MYTSIAHLLDLGATVIRAYGLEQRFIRECGSRVDLNQICYYPSIVANRWLSIRLETIGNLVVLFASLFAVIEREKGTMDPGYVGLSITYALSVSIRNRENKYATKSTF
jgi:ATP-binding cassette subfamily C (CFTR/MRP) protein 1